MKINMKMKARKWSQHLPVIVFRQCFVTEVQVDTIQNRTHPEILDLSKSLESNKKNDNTNGT